MKLKICNVILGFIVFTGYLYLSLAIRDCLGVEPDTQFSGMAMIIGIACVATFILSLLFGIATFRYIVKKNNEDKSRALAWTFGAMIFPPISTWFLINPNHFLYGLLNGSLAAHLCFLILPFIFVSVIAIGLKHRGAVG